MMKTLTACASVLEKSADAEQIWRERRRQQQQNRDANREAYRLDPVAYAWDVHGVWLWGTLANAARAIHDPPRRILIESANSVGKTKLAAVLTCWFHDCFDPGISIITAPRFEQLKDTTFKEVRSLFTGRPGLYPKLPRLEHRPDHYIHGTTANDATAFQGIHCRSLFVLFEEATGIAAEFWEAARGILAGGEDYWTCIYNPTDPSSQVYLEKQSGRWRVFRISRFEHPNIMAELAERPVSIPAAVRLGQLLRDMDDWGDGVTAWPDEQDAIPTDVDLWSPLTYGLTSADQPCEIAHGEFISFAEVLAGAERFFPGRFWRPGPIGEARIIGRYPRLSAYALFSEAMFDLADRTTFATPWGMSESPTIGCDVARFGDDATAIHVRRGQISLHHETYRGRDTTHTAGRLKELARLIGKEHGFVPTRLPIQIDDSGVGGGVTDQMGDFHSVPIVGGWKARDEERYPNIRSEALFDLAERMDAGRISLARLPESARLELRRQAVGITYKLDASGRRVAEPKDQTKKRLRRSPDDLDALSLAYYEWAGLITPGPGISIATPPPAGFLDFRGHAQVAEKDQYSDPWNRR